MKQAARGSSRCSRACLNRTVTHRASCAEPATESFGIYPTGPAGLTPAIHVAGSIDQIGVANRLS